MTNEDIEEALKTYTVVILCSEALFRIPSERGIRLAPMRSPHGNYELTFLQRTEQVPLIRSPIPRQPWIQVKGPAPSIEVAINLAAGSASDYVRRLAFGANAWQGLISVHLAYDSTAGSRERQFFQNWVVDERGLPRVAREVDPDLMYRLLHAIELLPEREKSRFVRSIVQYTDALQYWKPGSELYALSHLYMGVEAITPAVIEREVARRGLTTSKQLEHALNGPPADSAALRLATYLYRRAGGRVPSRLVPWARRELIFRGDRKIYRAAQRASNQLEHGSAHHAEVHKSAVQAVEETARYLRTAMLDLLQLDEDDRAQLISGAYRTPLGSGGFGRQLHGVLKSDDEQLAQDGQLHPHVQWDFNLRDLWRTESGALEMRVDQKIQGMFGPNTVLSLERIAFAGATPKSHTNVEFDVRKGDAPREEITTKAGAQLAVDHPGSAVWAQLVGSYALNANSLPQMSRFWLVKLDPSIDEAANTFSLDEVVQRILAIVASDARLSVHQEECQSLWEEAVSADEVRSQLSAAFPGETGLVIPILPSQGKVSVINDPQQLRELVDHLVQLVKRLATLLDELLALRA